MEMGERWLSQRTSVQEYTMPCHARDANENEILQWQRNGWLLPYSEEELGPP